MLDHADKSQLLQLVADIEYSAFLEALCLELRAGYEEGILPVEDNPELEQRVVDILESVAPKYDKSVDQVMSDFSKMADYFHDMYEAAFLRKANGLH